MIYLLDSNVWIALIRRTSPALDARFRAIAGSADIRTCSIVNAELWYGCERSAKPNENRAALESLLAPFPVLPFDDAASRHFAKIRKDLEGTGQVIGPFDLQIAAIAVANGCTLVTHNTREFMRVAGLPLEDWQI
jgi:tRNA(fMet)-specific endonuclease VapC